MLHISGLTKRYGGFELGPIDVEVGDEVLVVLGPSGCGKSTLLSVIAGITPPDDGVLSLHGRRLDGVPPESRRVGMVFQDGALFPHMTARENIAYAATDHDRVDELVATLEIEDVLDRPTPTLSGGERQRVALTRVLASEPDVLLLDEPLSSLDTPFRHRLRDELRELFTELSIPVVYVTHDQQAATVLGDRTAVLRAGDVVQLAPSTEIRHSPETPFVASFTGIKNVFRAAVRGDTPDGRTLVLADQSVPLDGAPADRDLATVSIRSDVLRVTHRNEECEPKPGRATFDGVVRRRIDDGDATRIVCDVRGLDEPLEATVIPATRERDVTRPGTPVRLSVAHEDVHRIPGRDAEADRRRNVE